MAEEYISREAVQQCRFTQDEHGEWILAADILAIPAADVVPVVRCGECKHWERDVQIGTCSINGERHFGGWFCADGEREDGAANVQNWEKNHLRPTNMSGTKCEPCKPTQPECGDCEYIKDGDGDA